jgi:hypothetical protein
MGIILVFTQITIGIILTLFTGELVSILDIIGILLIILIHHITITTPLFIMIITHGITMDIMGIMDITTTIKIQITTIVMMKTVTAMGLEAR